MSTATAPTTAELVAAAVAARDEGMRQVEDSDLTGWNRALLDQAIDAFALTGRPFSANDMRDLLPDDLPSGLYGARFHHAANNRGVIRFVGYTRSTKKNTHAKAVALWVGVPQGE